MASLERPQDRFAELYRAYGPVIYSRCRRLLGEAAAAEDATQETFLRVLRHLETTPARDEALRWIYRIATNYCLNELRDQKKRPEPQESLPEGLDVGRPGEELLADRDLAARLVQRAPEKLRSVAWLHFVDGMEQAEVALVLGISRRTVINRLAEFTTNARKFAQRSS
jgi:RNA polymerase sigma-70 factor (ECF subfamily)